MSSEGVEKAEVEVPEVKVPPVENEVKIETGKLEGVLKDKFIAVYNLIRPLGDGSDHSPQSVRHHIKVGKRGIAVMFYNKSPSINLPVVVENQKKAERLKISITEKGLVGPEGNITQKALLAKIREYKKSRGL